MTEYEQVIKFNLSFSLQWIESKNRKKSVWHFYGLNQS